MRKSLTLLAFALLCTIATFAQTVLVQGQVTDDRGPVPNATVQEKGTKNITRADELGKFSFKVKQGALVVVTAVGHAPFEFAATTGYQNVKITTIA